MSVSVSPNLLEPDEKITDDEMKVVFNSYAEILPVTLKLPSTFAFPSTSILFLNNHLAGLSSKIKLN